MEIRLKVSKAMPESEYRIIRVPKALRDKYRLDLGGFINLRTKSGALITLQIEPAFEYDLKFDDSYAFLTENVFNSLKLDNISENCEINVVNNITLGCDPEFFLINVEDGKLLHTNRYFRKRLSDIGYDHGGLVAEFRPAAHEDENVVCDNLFKLICEARRQINENSTGYKDPRSVMQYGASHFRYFGQHAATAGFHLHYGIPRTILDETQRTKPILNQIVKCLDYYLGIPAMIPEGTKDSYRRADQNANYGKPGEYRRQLGFGTLEYRVPGGNLLRHPILSKGILGLGAIVVEDVISRIKEHTNGFKSLEKMTSLAHLRELYPHVVNAEEIFSIVCSKSTEGAYKHIDTIIDDVGQMVGFEKRKKSIEEFFSCITSKKFLFGHNIENNWQLYYQGGSTNAKFAKHVDIL